MLIYALLVLRYRADLKTAIPTSVLLMAFTSVVGISVNIVLSHNSSRYAIDIEVFHSWLAAAPVVAMGAPLGAFVVQLIPRTPTIVFVAMLCIAQFVWTVVQEQVAGLTLALSLLAIGAINVCFVCLYRLGHQLASEETIMPTHSAKTNAE